MNVFWKASGEYLEPTTVAMDAGAATQIVGTNTKRTAVTLKNTGAETVYIGKAGVDSSTGFPLAGGESITVATDQPIFGRSESGTPGIAVWEEQRG